LTMDRTQPNDETHYIPLVLTYTYTLFTQGSS